MREALREGFSPYSFDVNAVRLTKTMNAATLKLDPVSGDREEIDVSRLTPIEFEIINSQAAHAA